VAAVGVLAAVSGGPLQTSSRPSAAAAAAAEQHVASCRLRLLRLAALLARRRQLQQVAGPVGGRTSWRRRCGLLGLLLLLRRGGLCWPRCMAHPAAWQRLLWAWQMSNGATVLLLLLLLPRTPQRLLLLR
jgi:hypothetical protein